MTRFESAEGPLPTEIVLEIFLGAVILTGFEGDSCTVISGNLGLSEDSFLAP